MTELISHHCLLCREPVEVGELIAHLRQLHPGHWDDSVDRPGYDDIEEAA